MNITTVMCVCLESGKRSVPGVWPREMEDLTFPFSLSFGPYHMGERTKIIAELARVSDLFAAQL